MPPLRVAVPDLISNSYFPIIAAVDLGFFKAEGLDATIELLYPVPKTMEALRDGVLAFAAGAAHAPLMAFPDWQGVKLLAALAQNTYWFLVVRSDLGVRRGDLAAMKGLRIGAAPGVNLALQQLLVDAGVEGVQIGPVPGTSEPSVSFGVTAAKALEEGKLDGFWANGMGAEVAVRRGVGTIVLDARRGEGPPAAVGYTFSMLAATDRLIAEEPQTVAAAVRALVKTQQALKEDPTRATETGRRLFPPDEAELIAELIRRDLPYYNPAISEASVASLNRFAQEVGLLSHPVPYEQVVATQFRDIWRQ